MPVTITGDNFVNTPTVKIGATVVTNVAQMDVRTLGLTLPPLAPGAYSVMVFNPGGQTGELTYPIVVGKRLYLPLVRR